MRRPSAVTGASWQRQAGPSNAAARSARRPQIRVAPTDDGFDVIVADTVVRHCDQEGDAHHWAMHVFEAVNRNVYRPHAIRGIAAPSLPAATALRHASPHCARFALVATGPLALAPRGAAASARRLPGFAGNGDHPVEATAEGVLRRAAAAARAQFRRSRRAAAAGANSPRAIARELLSRGSGAAARASPCRPTPCRASPCR